MSNFSQIALTLTVLGLLWWAVWPASNPPLQITGTGCADPVFILPDEIEFAAIRIMRERAR